MFAGSVLASIAQAALFVKDQCTPSSPSSSSASPLLSNRAKCAALAARVAALDPLLSAWRRALDDASSANVAPDPLRLTALLECVRRTSEYVREYGFQRAQRLLVMCKSAHDVFTELHAELASHASAGDAGVRGAAATAARTAIAADMAELREAWALLRWQVRVGCGHSLHVSDLVSICSALRDAGSDFAELRALVDAAMASVTRELETSGQSGAYGNTGVLAFASAQQEALWARIAGGCRALEHTLGAGRASSSLAAHMKLVLVGGASVGKTSLVARYVRNDFAETVPASVSAALTSSSVIVGAAGVSMEVWDTAGHEMFRSLARTYYRDAAGVVVVYDVTSRDSFARALDWLAEVQREAPAGTFVALVANKIDVGAAARRVQTADAVHEADVRGVLYAEVSARTGAFVAPMLRAVAAGMIESHRDAVRPVLATSSSGASSGASSGSDDDSGDNRALRSPSMASRGGSDEADVHKPPAIVPSSIRFDVMQFDPVLTPGVPLFGGQVAGWLIKLGGIVKSLKARWFVVNVADHTVRYFAAPRAERPVGTFDVTSASRIELAGPSPASAGMSCIRVICPSRTWYLLVCYASQVEPFCTALFALTRLR